jgi:hypothetical protein
MCAGWVGGWRRRRRLRAAGRGCLHFFRRRVTGAHGCGQAFGPWHLPPRRRPRLTGGLRGGSAYVQRRARWDEESSRRCGCVAGVGATARVCRMGRRRDGGGGGGRWNGVGRGRRGAGGCIHHRDCAGGHAEARIGRWGGEAWGEVSAWGFFAPASTDAAR